MQLTAQMIAVARRAGWKLFLRPRNTGTRANTHFTNLDDKECYFQGYDNGPAFLTHEHMLVLMEEDARKNG